MYVCMNVWLHVYACVCMCLWMFTSSSYSHVPSSWPRPLVVVYFDVQFTPDMLTGMSSWRRSNNQMEWSLQRMSDRGYIPQSISSITTSHASITAYIRSLPTFPPAFLSPSTETNHWRNIVVQVARKFSDRVNKNLFFAVANELEYASELQVGCTRVILIVV